MRKAPVVKKLKPPQHKVAKVKAVKSSGKLKPMKFSTKAAGAKSVKAKSY